MNPISSPIMARVNKNILGSFPELYLFDAEEERANVWRRARHAVPRRPRAILLAIVYMFAVILWKELNPWTLTPTGKSIEFVIIMVLLALVLGRGQLWLNRRRIRQFILEQAMASGIRFCTNCRYCLKGQDIPRCPECGCLFGFDVPIGELGISEGEIRRHKDSPGTTTGA